MLESPNDILISVKPSFVDKMMEGCKTVELRRRSLPVEEGSRIWIYSTLPSGNLAAVGIVSSVHHGSPTDIWERFGPQTGLSASDFNAYFAGTQTGCAIIFEQVSSLNPILSLSDLRASLGTFCPPQFFRKLRPNDPELNLFRSTFGEKAGSPQFRNRADAGSGQI